MLAQIFDLIQLNCSRVFLYLRYFFDNLNFILVKPQFVGALVAGDPRVGGELRYQAPATGHHVLVGGLVTLAAHLLLDEVLERAHGLVALELYLLARLQYLHFLLQVRLGPYFLEQKVLFGQLLAAFLFDYLRLLHQLRIDVFTGRPLLLEFGDFDLLIAQLQILATYLRDNALGFHVLQAVNAGLGGGNCLSIFGGVIILDDLRVILLALEEVVELRIEVVELVQCRVIQIAGLHVLLLRLGVVQLLQIFPIGVQIVVTRIELVLAYHRLFWLVSRTENLVQVINFQGVISSGTLDIAITVFRGLIILIGHGICLITNFAPPLDLQIRQPLILDLILMLF